VGGMTKDDSKPTPEGEPSEDPLTDPKPDDEKPGSEWVPKAVPAEGDGPVP